MNEKAAVGEKAAVDYVKDGMVVGLGTGSTVYYTIVKIGEMIKEGMKVQGVATSVQTEKLAEEQGIPLLTLDKVESIDVAIDGADEIDHHFYAIKGGGGALLREKIIARASNKFVVVADSKKVVQKLGSFPLPVEVVPFGVRKTESYIQRFGCQTVLRMKGDTPYITDNGNYIIDCTFDVIANPKQLEKDLNNITGVVENGLFIDMVKDVITINGDKQAILLDKLE
ncbi:ribose-5-phosphate isomerase RpiA [Niallia taxi]|uniref:Ribose-5-phosphate isomerase A n=1 Tax=Niallia taxi TaxID=2499688 RepID=A0A3S2X3P5_9BACI|nr:ribose-5-phosphate isomerase RpiA [Niallia taxi]MCM3217643.1 ribose-5-phosphate isomerase RpiA [Niallia taxi]MDK8640365.1 ribose-5-phosphate isomerase RpiA [Niallia taxi]MED4037172.1 ribose-5-phosphate isomerase RpiA [Niallia taxi]MED4054941.1 ribose-5-phosphate isomerase RpiA [Niallia taxi]MED4121047.1 ribose-5-phosphate isomerase RpiA [Niallia taxi]